jgi:hypothetical protein
MEDTKNAYRILIDERLEKIPFGGQRIWWVGNIKMGPKEIRCEDGDRL